jgi:hypothetical protein
MGLYLGDTGLDLGDTGLDLGDMGLDLGDTGVGFRITCGRRWVGFGGRSTLAATRLQMHDTPP